MRPLRAAAAGALAAEAPTALVDGDRLDLLLPARLAQPPGGRQPGHAAAEDRDAPDHRARSRSSAIRSSNGPRALAVARARARPPSARAADPRPPLERGREPAQRLGVVEAHAGLGGERERLLVALARRRRVAGAREQRAGDRQVEGQEDPQPERLPDLEVERQRLGVLGQRLRRRARAQVAQRLQRDALGRRDHRPALEPVLLRGVDDLGQRRPRRPRRRRSRSTATS